MNVITLGNRPMTIPQYQRAIRLINQNLVSWCEEILQSLDKEIVGLVQEQLSEGKRGDGSMLPLYKKATIISKQERGSVIMGSRIALIDNGDFWKGMFADIGYNSVIVDSKDWKRDMLVERYTEAIFYIDPINKQYLSDLLYPKVKAKIDETFAKA